MLSRLFCRSAVTVVTLVALLVGGTMYMLTEYLSASVLTDSKSFTVQMQQSGGLMTTSPVTLRGIRIGRVSAIDEVPGGLNVRLAVDANARIPIDSPVDISNGSAAGQQYLNFSPTHEGGPYLRDGATIGGDQVQTTVTVSEMLQQVNALTRQLDPNSLQDLLNTMDTGFGDDSTMAGLARAIELMSGTLRDKNDELQRIFVNAQILGDGFGSIQMGQRMRDSLPATKALNGTVFHLLTAMHGYADATYRNVWQQPIGPLVAKLNDYLTMLVPDFAFMATVVRPATQRLRPLRINLGSLVDVWERAFPSDGAARVLVSIPQGP